MSEAVRRADGVARARRRSARRGWSVVAGAFAVMFAGFGCAYSFSAFFASLQQAFDAPRGALSLVFSLATTLYFLVGAASGPLADRVGPRAMAFFGMVVAGGGLIAAACAQALWQVYFGYGLGIGIGVGFAYVPAVGAVQRWFVRRRGLASGLAVSGIGVGTLCMPLVAARLIDGLGWRGAYTVLGCFTIIAGGAAALLVDGAPQRRGMLPDGGIAAVSTTPSLPLDGAELHMALRSRPFVLLYAAALAASIGLFIPFVHLTPYAEDLGVPHGTAVTLFTLVGVGSTFGRFFLGGLADRLGRRRSLAAMYLGMALMLVWWLAATQIWQIALFALIFGTCYGGFVALSPALVVDYFGGRNSSGIIGALYTSVGIGTLIGPPFAGWAFDLFHSYTLPIAVSAGATFIGVAIVSLLPEPGSLQARLRP